MNAKDKTCNSKLVNVLAIDITTAAFDNNG